jgi:hypothetical protein
MQAMVAHLSQQIVFFEPGPQHGKIVDFIDRPHVKTRLALVGRGIFQEMDNLALSGSRAGDEDEHVKEGV